MSGGAPGNRSPVRSETEKTSFYGPRNMARSGGHSLAGNGESRAPKPSAGRSRGSGCEHRGVRLLTTPGPGVGARCNRSLRTVPESSISGGKWPRSGKFSRTGYISFPSIAILALKEKAGVAMETF
jgi:hypothetical protein